MLRQLIENTDKESGRKRDQVAELESSELRTESKSKPLLLIISQVFVPDPASVGQHIADVAEMMAARGHEVRVLTSSRGYENPREKYTARERRSGVDVIRLPFSSFGKRSIAHRLLGQILFLMQSIVRGVATRHLSGILVSTSPPMASFAALVIAVVRRAPITYWVMDLNPDQAIALGAVSSHGLFAGLMKWLNRRIYARAAEVVALDRFMAARITKQYRLGGCMEVLPPWPHVECNKRDTQEFRLPARSNVLGQSCGTASAISHSPDTRIGNPFIIKHKLDGRFVVMYSGNHSLASPVTTLLHASIELRDDPRFLFMFIGGGLGKREVDRAIQLHGPKNIISLPYQPLDQIQYSLSAANVHAMTLGSDMVGIIHPCKIYGAMAVARPILLFGPRPSHAADLIDCYKIGWQVDHGDVTGAVSTLRQIVDTPQSVLEDMGERARQVVQQGFQKEIACTSFCTIIERAAASGTRCDEARAGHHMLPQSLDKTTI